MRHSITVRFALVFLAIVTVSACQKADINDESIQPSQLKKDNATEQANALKNNAPDNIIMVIADGMGPAYVSAYRYYMDNPDTISLETTVFDQYLVGTSRTHPHQMSGYVTDSASSATAMATGFKTYNGAIGMNIDKQPLETVLHRAKKYGLKTGIAVTSQIVHATPASYMVANEARRNYNQIADSYFDNKMNYEHLADVMLGGGWEYFIREDKNLVELFKSSGYQYVDTYTQLKNLDVTGQVLGLFADTGLPRALDDTDPFRLRTLTQAAVKQLENNSNGFFLLVEASQVDWAGHANDIASAMSEMDDLAKTMEYLYEYAKNHPNTLVVLTADHSTGGLTIGSDGEYRWSPQYLKNHKSSMRHMRSHIRDEADMASYFSEQVNFELTQEETDAVNSITDQMSEKQVEMLLASVIDKRSNTGWTTSGHTAVDVEVFAFGPGADLFKGNQNNTDIAEKMFRLLDQKHQ